MKVFGVQMAFKEAAAPITCDTISSLNTSDNQTFRDGLTTTRPRQMKKMAKYASGCVAARL